MTEVRCPMCSTLNPDTAEVCQNCQARLKPLLPPSGSELPDWLISDSGPAGEEADWLRDLLPDEADAAAPDWLSHMRSESAAAEEEAPDDGEPLAGSDEAPNWLQRLGTGALPPERPRPGMAEPPAPTQPEDELNDWLASLDADEPPASTPTAAPSDRPDWLLPDDAEAPSPAWLQNRSQPPADSAPLKGTDDLPAWLHEISSESPLTEPEQAPALPDWMQPTPPPASAVPVEPASQDLPDWLLNAPPPEPAPAPKTLGPLVFEDDEEAPPEDLLSETPDWMKSILSDQGQPPPAAENLDWLAPASAPEPPPVSPFAVEETGQELEPIYSGDDPDWLAELAPSATEHVGPEPGGAAEPPASLEAAEVDSDLGLAPAELPSWLEAMRPADSAPTPRAAPTFADGDERIAGGGPLAGLRGVLPAEPDLAAEHAPTLQPLTATPTPTEAAHAAALAQLIATEGDARPLPARLARSSQPVLRLLMALALVAAVLFGLFAEALGLGTWRPPLPEFPPETGAANVLIANLPPGAPVLVAFDYEPAFSGELNALAKTLLDHLMLKGAFLTVVSTNSSGPLLAEGVIAALNADYGHAYQPGVGYLNLGQISGGPSGLAGFAAAPALSLPRTLTGEAAWNTGPLQAVQALSQFGLVVVLTDSPDTARVWIEQVEPSLGATPLLLGVSAQAEPLVRPYYAGRAAQVDGMVTGLAGAVAYERLQGRQLPDGGPWSPFSLAGLTAILLIAASGIFHALRGAARRRKYGAQEVEDL